MQREGSLKRFRRKCLPHIRVPLLVVVAVAVLFVGFEVAERQLVRPDQPGLEHLLFTIRVFLISAVACIIVYCIMRHRQARLSNMAGSLAHLFKSYMNDPLTAGRFENPNLVHCREVLDCDFTDCPMYDATTECCWQVMAIGHGRADHVFPGKEIEKCHKCEVFRRSCPDELSLLGESYNNLLFLFRDEAQQVEQLRAEMADTEKMFAIGQLASGFAHEVGNPLSSISSTVQMLRRAGTDPETSQQLALIETHIHRISSIVRQLSRLARKEDVVKERIDVGKALDQAVQLVSFDRRSKNVNIDYDDRCELPCIQGFPGQLDQVFINLALNSLDAMPDGGELAVTRRVTPNNIIIEIADSGEGIAPDAGRRIFDPFYTTKPPGCGTGLGLAVSHSIIRKLGGTVEYESSPGQGTVFRVYIPVRG